MKLILSLSVLAASRRGATIKVTAKVSSTLLLSVKAPGNEFQAFNHESMAPAATQFRRRIYPAYFAVIACIAAVLYLLDHFIAKEILDIFWILGVVFVFGFWRYLGNFAKFGDFSNGVYIVHWPIIQTVILLGHGRLSPPMFLLLSLTLVALTSVLMWLLVEKSFLKTSSHYRQGSKMAPT